MVFEDNFQFKASLYLGFVISVITIIQVNAQASSGIITYRGVINEKFVDSFLTMIKAKKDVSMRVKQIVTKAYRNAKPDEFKLYFKGKESYYEEVPRLEDEDPYAIGSRASRIPHYTNLSEESVVKMTSYIGDVAVQHLDWKVSRETKSIGNYNCYKATAIERLYSRQGHYYSRKITAWFSPEIPVNFCPQNYSGLHGLILQLQRHEFTLTATDVNLNPKKPQLILRNRILMRAYLQRLKPMGA